MKRKFYQSPETGCIDFHPAVVDQVIDLSEILSPEKLAALPMIDNEELVYWYVKAEQERYAAIRAVWEHSELADPKRNEGAINCSLTSGHKSVYS